MKKTVSLFSLALAFLCTAFVSVSLALTKPPTEKFANAVMYSFSFKPREFIEYLLTEKEEPRIKSPKTIAYGKRLDEVITEAEEEPENLMYRIVEADISSQSEDKKILLRNKTGKKLDEDKLNKLVNSVYPIKNTSLEEPLVLIVHTHTTESYAADGQKYYNPDKAVAETRSREDTKNVIAVGDAVCSVLESMGIKTLHCTDYHDIYVFNESYNHSYDTVKKYLSEYPSIKYVIDLHRDSVIRTNTEKVCPVTNVNGVKAAQMMLVVGTNDGGRKHDNWEKNFTLALKFQQKLIDKYGNLVRPVNLRSGRFNQQLSDGMLLWEVGSCGNTLNQAIYTARLAAKAYGELILENITC